MDSGHSNETEFTLEGGGSTSGVLRLNSTWYGTKPSFFGTEEISITSCNMTLMTMPCWRSRTG